MTQTPLTSRSRTCWPDFSSLSSPAASSSVRCRVPLPERSKPTAPKPPVPEERQLDSLLPRPLVNLASFVTLCKLLQARTGTRKTDTGFPKTLPGMGPSRSSVRFCFTVGVLGQNMLVSASCNCVWGQEKGFWRERREDFLEQNVLDLLRCLLNTSGLDSGASLGRFQRWSV